MLEFDNICRKQQKKKNLTTDQVINFRRRANLAFFHDIFDSRPTSSGRRRRGREGGGGGGGEGGGGGKGGGEGGGGELLQGSNEGPRAAYKIQFYHRGNRRVEIRNNNEARCRGRRAQSSVIALGPFFPRRGSSLRIDGIPFPRSLPLPLRLSRGTCPPRFYSPEWPVYTELPPTVFCSFRKLYTRSLPAGKQADACRPPPPPGLPLRVSIEIQRRGGIMDRPNGRIFAFITRVYLHNVYSGNAFVEALVG